MKKGGKSTALDRGKAVRAQERMKRCFHSMTLFSQFGAGRQWGKNERGGLQIS